MNDSQEYLDKKSFYNKVLTIYGRNSVLEVLEDESITIHRLHLSKSNKDATVLDNIKSLANKRSIETKYHDKTSLSRISKNSKQDQGVALDIVLDKSLTPQEFLKESSSYRCIALDGVTNPQNLGMIIRSCAAGNIDAIILPKKGSAQISPLVIKASVGTLFKIPIIQTQNLVDTLKLFSNNGSSIYSLSSHASSTYKEQTYGKKDVFILGNESEGVSKEVEKMATKSISIPMNRGVESLNVAVTASILAFI